MFELFGTARKIWQYALKATPSDSLVWGSAIQFILDGGDDVAREVNAYNANQNYGLFFHTLRVFQTSSQISSSGVQRDYSINQFYISKFIIDCEYHYNDRVL